MDLKSEKFPGAQIYIYVNIQLLDPLPERKSANGYNDNDRSTVVKPGVIVKKGEMIDLNQNKKILKEIEGKRQVDLLMEKKIHLEQENDRLKFQKELAMIE